MKEQLKKEIRSLDRKINKLSAQMKPLVSRRTSCNEQLATLEAQELLPLSLEKIANSDSRLLDGPLFKEVQTFMSKYKYVACEGTWTDTRRKAFRIALDQNDPLDAQIKEIEEIMAAIPFVDDLEKRTMYRKRDVDMDISKAKLLSVFEYTLSEYGVYNLIVNENNIAGLMKTTYGRSELVLVLPFREMIEYMLKNHPYQKIDEDDDGTPLYY